VAELNRVSDADLNKPWSLKMGERVLFTLPRLAVIRQNINHRSIIAVSSPCTGG
jgi:hypothetical protein